MEKLIFTTLFITTLLFQAKAQSDIPSSYNKAIFVEALGIGIGFSANYDMRIKKGEQDGFGFRVGIGGLNVDGTDENGQPADVGILTIPLALNYLVGERRSAFEAGLGVTPIYSNNTIYDTQSADFVSINGWGASGFIDLGYRFQPLRNGFIFRLDWAPAFNSSGFYPLWFGISAGFGFK